MSDTISRQAAIAYAISGRVRTLPTSEDGENWIRTEDVRQSLLTMPSAEPIDVPEKNVGKWTEKKVIHADEAKEIITEWQSCKCSICGRYDTRPYLYYFDEPNFCSWCGAEMKQGERREDG